jgi:hypothetical protein
VEVGGAVVVVVPPPPIGPVHGPPSTVHDVGRPRPVE